MTPWRTGNSVGDVGATALAKALRDNSTLNELDLTGTHKFFIQLKSLLDTRAVLPPRAILSVARVVLPRLS